MTRSLVTTLAMFASWQAAHADFAPTVLDRFDGLGSYTVTRDLTYSAGSDNIAGADWTGFGATSGTKAFHGTFNAASTGYAASTIFGSMSQSGGALTLDLLVPSGATLAGGGATTSNTRVTYTGAFDLSGKGGRFYFHLASTTALDASLGIAITSGGTMYAAVVATGPVGPRYVEVAFQSLTTSTGVAYAGDGSGIGSVAIGLGANTNLSGSRSGGLYEFGVVPTPATAALLGAGLLAARRRR